MWIVLQVASLARLLVPTHPIRVAADSVGCAGIGGIVDPEKPFTHHHLGRCWLSPCWQHWSLLLLCLHTIKQAMK